MNQSHAAVNRTGQQHVPLLAGGLDVLLVPAGKSRVGQAVWLRELDHGTEEVAHAILTDIMAEDAAGTIKAYVKYRGKNPRRWLALVFPPIFKPRFLGLFLEDGTLAGWISLVMVATMMDSAGLGLIVHAPHRNKGLGTAVVQYCIDHVLDIMHDPRITNLYYHTTEQNAPMLAISAKVRMQSLGKHEDNLRPGYVMVRFTSKQT
nr:GNAT family N-acetyltransferase [Candidatus Sigynarchaeota archaeon]